MKTNLKKVYSKLPNKKVDLKKQKVELGLQQEITALIDAAYYHAEAMQDMALESDKAYEKIQDALSAYNSLLDDYNTMTESFVYNRKEFLDNYVEIKPRFNAYLDATNELGVEVAPYIVTDMETLEEYFDFQSNSYADAVPGRFREIDQFGNFK